MHAQQLTVADGTSTNEFVPLYGYYGETAQHSQVLYRADMLTEMAGNFITTLSFYQSAVTTADWGTATIQMAIVDDSTVTSLITLPASAVQVWQGNLTGANADMNFVLTTPFEYTGGNLLVDITTTGVNYSRTYFNGMDTTFAASYYSYSYGGGSHLFIPKTTFSYNATGFVCHAPTDLTFDAATTTSLTFHWTHGGTESSWEVKVNDSIIGPVTDTFTTVNDLHPSAYYTVKVRSICSEGDTSLWSSSLVMATGCDNVTELPWASSFDMDMTGSVPLCWTVVSPLRSLEMNYTTYEYDTLLLPYITNSYMSGYYQNVLYYYFSSESSDPGYSLTAGPYIAHDPSQLHVSFYGYRYGSFTVEMGLMTDLEDTSTFVPLYNFTGTDYDTYEFYTDGAETLAGEDGAYLAIRTNSPAYTYGYLYLTDFVIEEMSDCLRPTLGSGSVDSISYDAVRLGWANTGADSYDVTLTNAAGTVMHYAALEDTLTITGLDGDAYYQAAVASICGEDTTEYLQIGAFYTHERCYSVQTVELAAITANAATITWSYVSEMGIEPVGVTIDMIDDSTGTAIPTVTATGTSYTFTGLTLGHSYTASLHTLCGESDTAYSVEFSFRPENPACAQMQGTSTNSYVPFYGYYNYGYSQALYPIELLDGVDTVNGMKFEVNAGNSLTRTVDVYMGYTSLTSLSSSNFVPATDLTLVASDVLLDISNEGWSSMISFSNPFVTADTTGKLVIAVVNKTGSWSSVGWRVTNGANGSSVYWYNDGNQYDPANPNATSTGYTSTAIPNVRLYGSCGSTDCVAPSAGAIAADPSSVTLQWLPGGTEASWTVQYRQPGDSTWNTTENVTDNPYIVTGLNSGTTYEFRVGAECGEDVAFCSPFTYATQCGLFAAPFGISLVGTGEVVVPNCWDLNNTSWSTNGINLYSSYRIITPQIADPLNNLQVTIEGRAYSTSATSNQYLQIGACDANGNNIVWIDTVQLPIDQFENRVFFLNSYTGTANRLIIMHTSSCDTYVRSVLIETLGDCMPVLDVTVDSVATDAIALSWTSETGNYVVRYAEAGDTVWNETTSEDESVVLTGLNDGTTYTIQVMANCGSSLSNPQSINATTQCLPLPIPYGFTFDFSDSIDALPLCWETYRGTPNNVSTSFANYVTYGYNYIRSYAGYSTNPANDWLVLPTLQIPSGANNPMMILDVSADVATYYLNSHSIYMLIASTNGNEFNDTVIIDTLDDMNLTRFTRRINLSRFNGQSVRLALVNMSTMYSAINFYSVAVRETTLPVFDVEGPTTIFTGDTMLFTATQVEGSTNSLTLAWTSKMAEAGNATIISGANSDSLTIVYTAAGIDTITFVGTNSYGVDTSMVIAGVYQCDEISAFPYTMDFELPGDITCWLQEGPGEWTIGEGDYQGGSSTFAHNGNSNLKITHYTTGDVTKLISPVINLGGDTSATLTFWMMMREWASDLDNLKVYYRTNDTADWNMLMNQTAAVESWTLMTVNLPNTTSTYQIAFEFTDDYGYGVAIDDLTITGSSAVAPCNEPVIASTSVTENSATVNWSGSAASYEVAIMEGTWTAPAAGTATTDTTYTFSSLAAETTYAIGVRAMCDGTNSDWAITSVTTDAIPEAPCDMPTSVNVSAITYTSATITWTAAAEQNQWKVRVNGTGLDTTISATATTVTLVNLIPASNYSVEVRSICSATSQSDWTTPMPFTTQTCQPVTGVSISNISAHGATISWTSTGAATYEIEYGMAGFNQGLGTLVQSNTNSVTLSGLEDDSPYDVYVRSICATGVYSTWSDASTFTTLEAGDETYYTVTVNVNDATMGTVTGGGSYAEGSTCTITANANEGYRFVKWDDDVTTNPRTFTVMANVTFTAIFEQQEGINDAPNAELSVHIYPNPATDMVNVDCGEWRAEIVEVIDMNGRVVMREQLLVSQTSFTLDASTLAAGSYFVRLTGADATAVRKLIVK